MKKIILVLVAILLVGGFSQVRAEATTTESTLLQQLQEQVEALRAQIQVIQSQILELKTLRGSDDKDEKKEIKGDVNEGKKEIKGTLRILKRLRRGMSGEDVTLLQEILATDPDVYPEGLITGYFGRLTEQAVKKFQKKAGFQQVGLVGPKTTAKLNELLELGAGNSGKVPPGFLIAPGIRKKLGLSPQPLSGQNIPRGIQKKLDGTDKNNDDEDEDEDDDEDNTTTTPPDATTTPDVTPPVISDVTSTSTKATSTVITWITDESSTSVIYYGTLTPVETETSIVYTHSIGLVTKHEVIVTELFASTTYYYIVSSSDEAGNEASSTEQSFITQ